jgi:hypothetical protein
MIFLYNRLIGVKETEPKSCSDRRERKMPPRTNPRFDQLREESLLRDPMLLAQHIQKVNEAGKLKIVFHGMSREPQDITHFEITYYGGGASLLEIHVAESLEDIPDLFREDAEEIQYKPPMQNFTVIGPDVLFAGMIAARHMKARSWTQVVQEWRDLYCPQAFKSEDPSVFEGFITPLNVQVITYSEEA